MDTNNRIREKAHVAKEALIRYGRLVKEGWREAFPRSKR